MCHCLILFYCSEINIFFRINSGKYHPIVMNGRFPRSVGHLLKHGPRDDVIVQSTGRYKGMDDNSYFVWSVTATYKQSRQTMARNDNGGSVSADWCQLDLLSGGSILVVHIKININLLILIQRNIIA